MIDAELERANRKLNEQPLPFALGRTVKVETRPTPSYVFEVNGQGVRLSLKDILSPRRFAREVLRQTDQVVPQLTRAQLDLMLIRACRRLEHTAAAPGRGKGGRR